MVGYDAGKDVMDANDYAEQERKELVESYGGRAVGLTFNPSNLVAVDVIKTQYAKAINDLHATRAETDDPEKKALCGVAIEQALGAQMWAVKAKTWGI